MPQKTALITGISGMVGSHLLDFLLENTDWKIVGICRWRSPLDNIEHILPRLNKEQALQYNDKSPKSVNSRIILKYADILDAFSLITVLHETQPDYVFHLAAQSFPLHSFTQPIQTLATNIIGTANLLEALKDYIHKTGKHPIIHICASSEVFGRVPKEALPISETVNFHPASPYAISKVGTDLLGRHYAEAYGMHIMTTRMFSHTGPRRGDVFAESSFAKQIAAIELGLVNHNTVFVGNLESLRTWADVRDAVRAYYMLVTVNPIAGEYYNIGGSYVCKIGEMLGTLISLSGHKDRIRIEVDKERLRPIDADLQVPDTSKFKLHTGWEPAIPFKTTMQDLLNYWRKNLIQKPYLISR